MITDRCMEETENICSTIMDVTDQGFEMSVINKEELGAKRCVVPKLLF